MRRTGILIFLLVCGLKCFPTNPTDNRGNRAPDLFFIQQDSILATLEGTARLKENILQYEQALAREPTADNANAFRQLAFSHAQLAQPAQAAEYARKYLHAEFRPEILSSLFFDPVRSSPEFREVARTYTPNHSFWTYFYLYVGFIGLYIASLLFLHSKVDSWSRALIGGFVLIHSFFILHICLVITNYQFQFPHSYLISTGFSFLYGPLLYFYFKRTTRNYQFRPVDLLHLLPTVLLLVLLIPYYNQTGDEKLQLMLNRVLTGSNPSDSANLILIVILKLISLIAYGLLIRREFLKNEQGEAIGNSKRIWMRNIFRIHVAYICCYAIYGALIIYQDSPGGILYHAQVISMSLMVLYVGYFASLRPQVFGSRLALDQRILGKYRKSGLTESLSFELRDKLLVLFDEDEIFRENDLNLDGLASRMDTTRHNASQVINEHFGLSFHELLNKYRIDTAKDMLRSDFLRNLNIIDIAYEVGYNNKVTFNKAFKKDTDLTPSQYQTQMLQPSVNQV